MLYFILACCFVPDRPYIRYIPLFMCAIMYLDCGVVQLQVDLLAYALYTEHWKVWQWGISLCADNGLPKGSVTKYSEKCHRR